MIMRAGLSQKGHVFRPSAKLGSRYDHGHSYRIPFAGTLITFFFFTQVLKTFRSKRCDYLSRACCLPSPPAFACGSFMESSCIMLANLVTLLLLIWLVVMKVRYGRAYVQSDQ
jgi:uncharacterized protein with PQ loop repeat